MVKLKGPMGSMQATGTLADIATFSSWKGRAYARRTVIPTNPNSPAQVANRAMVAFLSSNWAALYAAWKTSWDALATLQNIPPYNAYIKLNLDRWSRFKAPSVIASAPGSGTLPDLDYYTASGYAAHVDLFCEWYSLNSAWPLLIFRSQTPGFTTDNTNLIAAVKLTATTGIVHVDSGLAPGTYYYNLRAGTTAAKLGPQLGQQTAVVT